MSSIPPTDDHNVWDEGNFVPELHASLDDPISDDTAAGPATANSAVAGLDEPLPVRPRRKLVTRATVGLAAVVLVALGFTGGVLVQQDRGGTTSAAGPGAMGAMGAAGGRSAAGGASGTAAAGTASSGTTSTSGEVANVKGGTVYVTTTDGSTVRVVAATGASVQRTSKASMTGVHPGDTVTVSGTKQSDGTISATSVSATANGVTASGGGFPGGMPGGMPSGAPAAAGATAGN